jgi:DNA-binding transcriptional LysR family regulator
MSINFRQLQVFRAVAEVRSFTRASQALFISQSTVSQHIRDLEDLLRIKLFDRTRRTVSLSAAGENLLRHSNQVFQLLDEAENAVHVQSNPYSGRLSMGCASTTLLYQMPSILVDYARKYPDVDLKITGGTIREIAAEMWAGSSDLALVVLPLHAPDLKKLPVCEEPFLAVLPASHRMARNRSLEIEELAGERFILHLPGQNTRKLVDRFLFQHHVTPRVPIELGETETIKRMVSHGLGVSLLPASAFLHKGSKDGLKLFPIPQGQLKRSLAIVYPKQKTLGAPALAMIDILQARFGENKKAAAARNSA